MAKILIIDDDAHTCRLVGNYLGRQGFEVTSATDGGAGLAAVAAELPDLILCDLNLPGMNGQGVVSALRHHEKWGEVPVIFLSGCTDQREIRRTMNLGADDFLTKPAQLRDILEAVNARLSFHREKQQREESRLAAAASVFAGIIHDLENPTAAAAAGDAATRASQILEQVRQRLYPAKGVAPAPAVFLAKTGDRQSLVKLSEVRLLAACGEYSQAHWGANQHMLLRKSLKSWERELPARQFVRVHRQALVNLAWLEQVDKTGGRVQLRLRDLPTPVAVSLRCAPELNRRLKQYQPA